MANSGPSADRRQAPDRTTVAAGKARAKLNSNGRNARPHTREPTVFTIAERITADTPQCASEHITTQYLSRNATAKLLTPAQKAWP